MKFIDKKDKKYFKIFGVVVVVIWNIIILVGFFIINQRIDESIKTSGEINITQMNLINELNQRIEKLEQK